MIDKQARQYLQEMGIDVWMPRQHSPRQPLQAKPSWPLVLVIDEAVLKQHLALFKGIVAAMQLDWADIHHCAAAHFPEDFHGWVLWADPTQNAPEHARLLVCDPQLLASDRSAKKALWQQICTQILTSS
jgi:DNA polymerase III psi subunit